MSTRHPIPQGNGAPMSAAEMADLLALGALSSDEVAYFEARLDAGDPEFTREFERVRDLETALLRASAGEGAAPPAHLRAGVEAGLRQRTDPDTDDAAAEESEDHGHAPERHVHAGRAGIPPAIVRSGRRRWRRTGLAGVRYCTLFADRRANRRTVLLEMGPGTFFPDHDHASIEEVILLEGDLTIAGTVLHAGDYIRNYPGTPHGEPRSEGGCIALIISAYTLFPPSSQLSMVWQALRAALGLRRDDHRADR